MGASLPPGPNGPNAPALTRDAEVRLEVRQHINRGWMAAGAGAMGAVALGLGGVVLCTGAPAVVTWPQAVFHAAHGAAPFVAGYYLMRLAASLVSQDTEPVRQHQDATGDDMRAGVEHLTKALEAAKGIRELMP